MKNKDGFNVTTRERLHDLLEGRLGDKTDAAVEYLEANVFVWTAMPLSRPHGKKRDAWVKARKALHDLLEALYSEDQEPRVEVVRCMARNGAFGPIPSSEELAAAMLASEDLPAFMRDSIDNVAHGLDSDPHGRLAAFVASMVKAHGGTPLDEMLKNLGLAIDVLIEVDVKGGRPINIRDKQITGAVADTLARFGIEPTRGGEMSASVFSLVLELVLIDLHDKVDDIAGTNAVDGLVRWAVEVRKTAQKPQ